MPIKYIPYTPDPIKGQALLNNIPRIQRLLRYRDNNQVFEKILRGMPYYELDMLEQVGKAGKDWNNLLLRGECLPACAYLKEQGLKVDLVYIDPPFASGANYAKKVYIRRNPRLAEKITQAEQEMELEELQVFEETMYGDIWQKEDYLNWMYENLMAIKSVMSESAGIYVHLDWHIGHYVKILMDEVFGEENFINNVTWKRYAAHSLSDFGYDAITDVILFYAKDVSSVKFDVQYGASSRDELAERFPHTEKETGRRYQHAALEKTSNASSRGETRSIQGRTVISNIGWIWSQETFEERLKANPYLIYWTKKGRPRYKIYADEYAGSPLGDIWTDINYLSSGDNQRLGYATQKPEALLERIIKASSDKDMIVADFFGGSGVTAKVAHGLNRRFIHCDVGINSLQITRDRLKEVNADFQIMDIKDGVSLFRNPQQTMDKLAKLIPGLQQQAEGIGNFWFGSIQDSKLGSIPVYVPDLINSSEKVLDIPVINRIINEELQKLESIPAKAIAYFVDVDDRKELEKFIRDNNPTVTEIELRDLKALLVHIVSNDEFEFSTSKKKNAQNQMTFITRITEFHSARLQQKITGFNAKRQLKTVNKNEVKSILISDEGLELIEWLAVDCKSATGPWHSSNEIKIDKLGYAVINGEKTKTFWDGAIVSKQKPLRIKIRNIAGDETTKTVEGCG